MIHCVGHGWMKSKRPLVEETTRLGVTLRWSQKPGDIALLTRRALDEGCSRLIVAGGDGSFLEAANVLWGTGVPLGFVPGGTGNDLIRTLGVSGDPVLALRGALEAPVTQMDVGLAKFTTRHGPAERIFLNIAEIGFGAQVVKRMNRLGRYAGPKAAYPLSLLSSLLTYRRQPIEISWGEESRAVPELTNLVVANGRFFGRGLQPTPNAKVDDGLFDILLLENFSAYRIATRFPALKDGPPPDEAGMTSFRCSEIQVSGPASVGVEADGEPLGHLPASFQIQEKAMPVMHPKQNNRQKRPG